MTDANLWWKHGVIYQIYPRSFKDSNGDGIGDLRGIIEKIEYLSILGIDAIWLSPINPSPDVDFGYDVSDYCAIDPKFGTMDDFNKLLDTAHHCGIRVILDLVLNHTSDQHAWFVESKKSRDNPYHDWYLWRDGKGSGPPNNWQSWFGGKGWEYSPERQQYYFHMFYKQQPDLNWRNDHVRSAMLNVFDFWLQTGVDGFRWHVYNAKFKHLDMPDHDKKFGLRGFDRQKHIYDFDQPEMIPLLEEIRSLTDRFGDRYLVGETFLSSPEKTATYSSDKLLHAAFNFNFLQSKWDARSFADQIKMWDGTMGKDRWPTWVLNNHDNPRSATRYKDNDEDKKLKAAAVILLTLRGTPFLYYGEEIGMRDIPVRYSQIKDPIGRRYWPLFKGRDGCRSPMQWNDDTNAGFGSGIPWLPVNKNFHSRNVAIQQDNPNSLFNVYKQVLLLRKQHRCLFGGAFEMINSTNKNLLVFSRSAEDEKAFIVVNFSSSSQVFRLEDGQKVSDWQLTYSTKGTQRGENGKDVIRLAPYEAQILLVPAYSQ